MAKTRYVVDICTPHGFVIESVSYRWRFMAELDAAFVGFFGGMYGVVRKVVE